jgi:hypothetical protein
VETAAAAKAAVAVVSTTTDGEVGSAHIEEVRKFELAPNEVKLEGASNYLSWLRRRLLLLKTKALDSHVLGEVRVPEDKKGDEWKKWCYRFRYSCMAAKFYNPICGCFG